MYSITIRDLQEKDLDLYLYWKNPIREHNNYNGPYYKRDSEDQLQEYISELRTKLQNGEKHVLKNKRIVVDERTDALIGEVNWYWKSEETNWMEIGLIIFDENYWGKGLGTIILTKWIDEIFVVFPQIVRIGLSTWSGNKRMTNLSEKIGLKKEAVYRKARIVHNEYFDSISYGILREEWEKLRENDSSQLSKSKI